jgi:hypothetical protein
MNLDEETIKKMVMETLNDSLEEGEELEEADVASSAKAEIAADTRASQMDAQTDIALSQKLDQVLQLLQKMASPAQPEQASKPTEPALNESFQIKKSRLREIVVEEMKKAKDQGLI